MLPGRTPYWQSPVRVGHWVSSLEKETAPLVRSEASRNPEGGSSWRTPAARPTPSQCQPQGSCCPEIKDESSSHRPRGKLCLRACGWSDGNRLQESRLADRDRPARVSVPVGREAARSLAWVFNNENCRTASRPGRSAVGAASVSGSAASRQRAPRGRSRSTSGSKATAKPARSRVTAGADGVRPSPSLTRLSNGGAGRGLRRLRRSL